MQIPLVSTGAAAGVLFLTVFCLAVLSAFGFDGYIKKPDVKKLLVVLILYGLAAISVVFVPEQFRRVAFRNLVIPMATASLTLFFLFVYVVIKRKNGWLENLLCWLKIDKWFNSHECSDKKYLLLLPILALQTLLF